MDLSGKGICDDEIAPRTTGARFDSKEGKKYIGRNANVSEIIKLIQNHPVEGLLDLSNNNIYAKGAMQILAAVVDLGKITMLDLSSNRIGGTDMYAFMPILLKTLKTTKVNLFNNPICDDIEEYYRC